MSSLLADWFKWLEDHSFIGYIVGALVVAFIIWLIPTTRKLLARGARAMGVWCSRRKKDKMWRKFGVIVSLSEDPVVTVEEISNTNKFKVRMDVDVSYTSQDDQNVNKISSKNTPTARVSTTNVGRVTGFHGKEFVLSCQSAFVNISKQGTVPQRYPFVAEIETRPIIKDRAKFTADLGECYVPGIGIRTIRIKGRVKVS